MFDVFANRLLNFGIDTTVIVDVSAVNLKKYGVNTVIFQVLAIISSITIKGTTVKVDIFGIN